MGEVALDLPGPMVPPMVDLRGLNWMPYYGDHLARSEFNAQSSDAAFRAGHNLWWAAWNGVPAASLPSDEASLTRFSDLGRDIKQFRKIKEHAMHGFVLCSDGRYYHPFLATLALDAWARRVRERERKAKWRKGVAVSESEWAALRAAVFARDDNKCVNCGSLENLNCDHILPISLGGISTLGNLQALCASCNKRKKDRLIMQGNDVPGRVSSAGHPSSVPGKYDAQNGPVLCERKGQDRTGQDSKKERKNSEAEASAPNGAIDPVKEIFDRGLAIYRDAGIDERKARNLLGKQRQEFGDVLMLAAVVACEAERPSEPIAFMQGCLNRAHRKRGPPSYAGGVVPMHPGAGG